ncbi:MAG: Glycosyl transferase, group 1 family protein [Chloroflexi bacterium AL-W]|nr:Glycosyl transferase, group 1 family protein [Chloroflexi bacterium AL-N1]NOK67401.1 Glycosyl transferase, group 1 family protein [Chloroflexi bacterium AL-N10]NOK75107.1 Glycosyl transferase, group 1 family protein [Chloroflexi bacterium AL-N5]NOK81894.1 Glycosyl transferase, group 1 family protein [Chloroflexi bacterium AL-W]NOK89740.1 Glycosyl transferase, group 1 family protein [Chloroflexi bacterium AL-N15]
MLARTSSLHVLIVGIGAVTRDFAPNWPEPVLARALVHRGHRVTVVGYLDTEREMMAAERDEIDGINVIRVKPGIWPGRAFARALHDVPSPDIMHVFHFRNVFIYNASAWAHRRGIPIVHSPVGPFHDAYLVTDRERPYTSDIHYDRLAYTLPDLFRQLTCDPRPRRQLTNYLLHAPLRRVSRFVASSYHEQDILQQMGFPYEHTEVIPLWIEEAPPLTLDESILADISTPIVLFIGQLTPRKGSDILVESLPEIVARHPTTTVVMVSYNPALQAELTSRAEALGVAERLCFVGRVSEAQKRALMRAATCMVIPSRYEGFGLPLLEAMQAEVPIVASNIPVVDEIVTDNVNGMLVAAENPSALAYGANRLIEDAALRSRLIAGGRTRLRDDFDEDTLITRMLTCYAKVLS